jgi:tetratricopeptide (TPR) repeat protein
MNNKYYLFLTVCFLAVSNIARGQDNTENLQDSLAKYVRMGDTYYNANQYRKAVECYNKAIDIYEYADLYYNLCRCYVALYDEQNAQNSAKKYRTLAPEGKYLPDIEQLLAPFKPVDWRKEPYQPTEKFWYVDYYYSMSFPIKDKSDDRTYKNNVLHGVSVGFMFEEDPAVKFALELSYKWIKINENMYHTGIRHYPQGNEHNYIYDINAKFKGVLMTDRPQFRAGDRWVGRITTSFGGGFGYISATDTPFVENYKENPEDDLMDLLGYIINNLSYEVTLGTLITYKDKPNGFKAEAVFSGCWQFKTAYRFLPYVGIRLGVFLGAAR